MNARQPAFAETVDWYNQFDVGVRAEAVPGSGEIRHVFYIVAYDICDPRRLRHVAKVCSQFGARIEKSVFQCDLPPEQFDRMWGKLIDIVDEEEDAVLAYRICNSCLKQYESMGIVPRPQKRVCYIL